MALIPHKGLHYIADGQQRKSTTSQNAEKPNWLIFNTTPSRKAQGTPELGVRNTARVRRPGHLLGESVFCTGQRSNIHAIWQYSVLNKTRALTILVDMFALTVWISQDPALEKELQVINGSWKRENKSSPGTQSILHTYENVTIKQIGL